MRHVLQIHRDIIPGPAIDFLVLSRGEALHVTPETPHIVISLTDPGVPEARLADCSLRAEVLRLWFHDTERALPGFSEITDEQALEIVRFVRSHRDSVRLIVCQCDAGMSRSAGVAAALSKWLQDEDEAFFRHYLPNRYVYDAVLRASTLKEDSG